MLLLAKGHPITRVCTHSPFHMSSRYSQVFVFLPILTHGTEGLYLFWPRESPVAPKMVSCIFGGFNQKLQVSNMCVLTGLLGFTL